MPPTELVILVGLQGSGKSSFYRTFFAGTHDWVSKDRLRNNRRPARRQRELIEEALQAGRSVVVDNTNATAADRAELVALGRAQGARVIAYYFESRLGECLDRNRARAGKARVPDIALFATYKRLDPPSAAEGFDALWYVRLLGDGLFEVLGWEEGRARDEPG